MGIKHIYEGQVYPGVLICVSISTPLNTNGWGAITGEGYCFHSHAGAHTATLSDTSILPNFGGVDAAAGKSDSPNVEIMGKGKSGAFEMHSIYRLKRMLFFRSTNKVKRSCTNSSIASLRLLL